MWISVQLIDDAYFLAQWTEAQLEIFFRSIVARDREAAVRVKAMMEQK